MHDTTSGDPCGLPDGHGGRHRTIAGAAREAARRRSQHYRESMARWKAAHPVQVALHAIKSRAKERGHR